MLHLTIAMLVILFAAVLVGIGLLVFEIWMFLDALRNPRLSDTERLIWCAAMLLIHPFAALAYYFLDSAKRRKI